jgi:hypothetical protein
MGLLVSKTLEQQARRIWTICRVGFWLKREPNPRRRCSFLMEMLCRPVQAQVRVLALSGRGSAAPRSVDIQHGSTPVASV